MNWFLGFLFLSTIWYLYNRYSTKKRFLKFKKYLIKNWGTPNNTTYYNFYSVSRYFENTKKQIDTFQIIDDKTADDLGIDALFKFLNRTTSKIGEQYLYYKLRTIKSVKQLNSFSTLTQFFEKNAKTRLDCQIILSKLSKIEAYNLESLIHDKRIEKPKSLWFIKLLSALSITTIISSFFYPISILLLLPIFSLNLFFHYKNKGNINYYIDGVSQLSKSLKVSKKLAQIPALNAQFKNTTFIEKINAIKLKTEFISFDNYLNNEFIAIWWFLTELFKIAFNLEIIVFFSFIDAINKEQKSIEAMFQFIGKIDAAISIASVKSENKSICSPVFTLEKKIKAKAIYHPLIENCIPNRLKLKNNSLLLTGSNMSGKTTFIRTIGINSLLAQTFYICFAENYTAPFFKIHSAIRISDDLLKDTSYYLEEVLTIKKLVDTSNSQYNNLFILDEIFKGTNTIERISGGKAILEYLNSEKNIVLVSTHDIELTQLLETKNYTLFHFNEQIVNNELFFDYQLKKGKLKTRNAIKILELNNYPSEIISNAKNTQKAFFKS